MLFHAYIEVVDFGERQYPLLISYEVVHDINLVYICISHCV